MTIQDATKIVYMLHAAFPQDRKATENDLLDRIDVYAVFFADTDARVVYKVVNAWIKSQPFMPNIEELKKACDIQKQIDRHLADAGIIKPEDLSPELQARLDALWDALTEDAEDMSNG